LRKLTELAPGHGAGLQPGAVEALLGNQNAALDWLRLCAEMGFAWDAAADADFASIRQATDSSRSSSWPTTASRSPQPGGIYAAERICWPGHAYDPKTKTFYVAAFTIAKSSR
jgi:hypothetical protein